MKKELKVFLKENIKIIKVTIFQISSKVSLTNWFFTVIFPKWRIYTAYKFFKFRYLLHTCESLRFIIFVCGFWDILKLINSWVIVLVLLFWDFLFLINSFDKRVQFVKNLLFFISFFKGKIFRNYRLFRHFFLA